MAEMKSAFERAMERVAKIGEPSKEEKLTWKYVPEGQRLAAEYLKEQSNLVAELGKFMEEERVFVAKGVEEVLFRNIGLPVSDFAKSTSRRAMEGIKAVKVDKAAVENVYSKMRRVFDHYEQEGEQQRNQTYEMLKQKFQARVQQLVQQQGGLPPGAKIDVESQPQFQEEWRRALSQLDSQYVTLLDEYKQEISGIR
ncbi:hypothetical protein ACFLXE_03805 [Chloroflexota bacterium]